MNKLITLLLSLSLSVVVKAQNPTWSDDVACIIYSHCANCHNPKGSGHISFLDYQEAKDNAYAILNAVSNKTMPPWPVNNAYRKFAHDRSLSDQEVSTIVQWVNNGAIKGNLANAPAQPVYSSSYQMPFPDLKLQIPTYTVPNITQDLYRCFVLPTGLTVQQFITGIEIIPGNTNIVHHAQVFYDTTGQSTVLDNNDPNPGYTSAGGIGVNSSVLLGTWVPGSSPIFVPNGMGKRLPSSAKIVVQIHYPAHASGQVDSSKFHFRFTSTAVRNIYDAPVLNHVSTMVNGPLFIPKNTIKKFYETFTLPATVTLISIFPHGHVLCKQLKAYAVNMNGDTTPLIDIPNWDFHWQATYDFQKPIVLTPGTKLVGEGVYDNTFNNLNNPNSPPQDVSAGEATTDEMMLFYFSYLAFKPGDANIIIDSTSHKPHHLNCVSTSIDQLSKDFPVSAFPNPFTNSIRINAIVNDQTLITVYNALGQIVYRALGVDAIQTEQWPIGLYQLVLSSGNDQKTIAMMKAEL